LVKRHFKWSRKKNAEWTIITDSKRRGRIAMAGGGTRDRVKVKSLRAYK